MRCLKPRRKQIAIDALLNFHPLRHLLLMALTMMPMDHLLLEAEVATSLLAAAREVAAVAAVAVAGTASFAFGRIAVAVLPSSGRGRRVSLRTATAPRAAAARRLVRLQGDLPVAPRSSTGEEEGPCCHHYWRKQKDEGIRRDLARPARRAQRGSASAEADHQGQMKQLEATRRWHRCCSQRGR